MIYIKRWEEYIHVFGSTATTTKVMIFCLKLELIHQHDETKLCDMGCYSTFEFVKLTNFV